VLLDGASAIYGTDAIGGVMNFITRKDYQGLQVDASPARPPKAAPASAASLASAGVGDIARDRFNVLACSTTRPPTRCAPSQRQVHRRPEDPERLPHLLSSATFPANIRLSRDAA
jgi:iron complex outermembrane receptor protein